MNLIFAQISERLDWFGYGISSVNRTGAFAACASLACLASIRIPRNIAFLLGLIGYLVFAYFMALTLSRGALIAWVCGSLFFIVFSQKSLGKAKSLAFLISLICILGFAASSGMSKRISDISTTSAIKSNVRTSLYVSGLKMLSDAPQGWNEEPQKVYATWYQDLDRSENYLSLINSHLQFMAQHGVFVRILYLGGWIFALMLAFPKRGELFNAVACSVFICTLISAFFSNVLNYWVLWILPVSFLLAALFVNFRKLKKAKFWAACLGFSIFSYASLHAISYAFPRDVKIFKWNDEIIVGHGETKAVHIQPVGNALGSVYGRELKEFLTDKNFSVLVSSNTKNVKYDVAIISSDFDVNEISKIDAEKIFILNARPLNSENFNLQEKTIEVILGDMSDWRRKRYWQNAAETNPQIKLTILSGVADYIPDWTKLIDGTFNSAEDSE